ncbi:MAG: hypothetical protein RMI89_06895 [Gloeomargarita sp. SKYBB_i_bin120]|nr:hypothetical protein [Gloeomargarita sp. SKYG98]MCS7292687.1 hypothetical protein [Gloeomargarita sp. SKYB120]MDW8178249.1 hypothetical protein [Gloeomargarita sp. SKYBB_i_bin120]
MWDAILMDHVETVPVGERWSVRSRLQDFGIHCECLNDGSLRIEIKNALEAILVSMVLFRFLTSRRQQVEWLERCWHSCAARGGEIL